MSRPICTACGGEIPIQNEEPPFREDTWQASVFIDGKEFRFHQTCYERAFDGAQAVLFA